MKGHWIDKQWRVFGKVHLFDALVFLGLVLLTASVVRELTRRYVWTTVDIKIAPKEWWSDPLPPPNWHALSLVKGEKSYDWRGKPVAELIDVRQYDSGWDRYVTYTTVRLLVQEKKRHEYNGQQLAIGKEVSLTIGKLSLDGIVINVDGPQPSTTTKIITLKLYDRYPWYADAIPVGGKMIVDDQIIAEIVEKNVEPSRETALVAQMPWTPVSDDNLGKIMVSNTNSNRKDITLKIKALVNIDPNSAIMFRSDQRVTIGNRLWIALPQVNITGASIVNIQDPPATNSGS